MSIKISTEGCDIISSGSVIIPSNDYVEFSIENLRFRFNMVQNSNDAESGVIQTNVESDDVGQCLIVTLVNFSSSFFATPKKALHLAKVNNRDLYFNFSLTSINVSEDGTDGLLFYTWMLSKESKNINQDTKINATE